MDKVFFRNYAIFVIVLLSCAGILFYSLISGERTLAKTDTLVSRTYDIILRAESISSEIESMLAAQRGFLITQRDSFRNNYEQSKTKISENIARLTELVSNNPSQLSRLSEMRNFFNELTVKLESRAAWSENLNDMTLSGGTITGSDNIELSNQILGDVEGINSLKDNIERLNKTFLSEEYKLLEFRVTAVNEKKRQYFQTLLVGVVAGTILLLLFNSFLLSAQRKRSVIESNLKDTEARFKLAVEGANDGIFDWNLKTGDVFYSKAFFSMLGYAGESINGTTEDLDKLLHPNDRERMWEQVDKYLSGELSEYVVEFRLKRKDESWAWIQSRAKGIFDEKGHATRMVGAHTDITELKNHQEKLQAEKQQAEEANRAKSDFLAHMSHEIRTPLTAISGIAEILSKHQASFDDKQKQLIHTLSSSTSSLKDLINDILDFSKIESDELELNNEPFELGKLFESVISMMALKANEKGVDFAFSYDALKEEEFEGDQIRVRQILVNLIGNSLKFTEFGTITVKAYRENSNRQDYLRIDVTDTGIGIAPEHFELVFERFKQADASVSRKYGGTGLGLPISKKLATLMGGDILLKSKLGEGSTFSVLLPYKLREKKPVHNNNQMNKKLSERIKKSSKDLNKILLVEDYEGNIVVLGYILEELGLAYDVARTGLEGLKLWQDNHYELVLMDVQMPEMDGFTATKKIRDIEKADKMTHTPIIGMTAHALVGDKDKCIEAGMDSYLPKPIVETELKKQIWKFLKDDKQKAA